LSFRKPFRAKPVRLGAYERSRQVRRRRRTRLSLAKKTAGLTVLVVAAGMAVTHRDKRPVYYPNCAYARAAGAAPIHKGRARLSSRAGR